jgi:sialate O-acetylesterase
MCKKLVVLSFVLCLASIAVASVSVPDVFTDHAVLQQGMDVPIWGTANSGEQVTVDFDGQSKSTTADGNGDWIVYLDPMSVSTTGGDLVITGDNSITITDVWVGEVWFFSGQSNMKRELFRSANASEAIADAPNHNIRWYNATQQWEDLATASRPLKNVSAVAYYFMHDLVHNYTGNIAMGIYQATSPGTDLTRFTTVQGDGGYYLDRIVPMQPYAIKGALWYQGENDGADINKAVNYDWVLTGLIDEWRTDWGQGDFPFGIVQLHDHSSGTNPIGWPVVQDAQLRVSLADSNAGLAVNWDTTLDGAPGHPDYKKPVAERLSLWARSQVYSQSGFGYSSPIPDQAASYINGNEIVVAFDYVGSGLITNDGAAPSMLRTLRS